MGRNVPSGRRLRILQLLIAHGKMTGGDLLRADASLGRGMIYTTLHRLEDDKLVKSYSGDREGQPGATPRLYEITGLGQQLAALGSEAEELKRRAAQAIPGLSFLNTIRVLFTTLLVFLGVTAASAEPVLAALDSRSALSYGSAGFIAFLLIIVVCKAWRMGILGMPVLVWALLIGGDRGLRQFNDLLANHRHDKLLVIDIALLTLSCIGDQLSVAWGAYTAASMPDILEDVRKDILEDVRKTAQSFKAYGGVLLPPGFSTDILDKIATEIEKLRKENKDLFG